MKPPPLFFVAPQIAASAGCEPTAGFGVKAPLVASVEPQAEAGIAKRPLGKVVELPVPDCAFGTQASVFGSAKQPVPESAGWLASAASKSQL